MTRSLLPLILLTVVSAPAVSGDTKASTPPNVLLICVDDLRPELNCFGKEYIKSPNIDQLAASGRAFRRHYVQAPTCGASRYALLTGQYGPSSNRALFTRAKRMAAGQLVPTTLPEWFSKAGYRTVSVGKVSHHPGGRGGEDWDDPQQPEMPGAWERHLLPSGPWKHPRGAMHGLAHGELRVDAGKMDVYQSVAGDDSIYPDGLIVETAIDEMNQLAADDDAPFFLAVGIIRPHLPFGAPAQYMQPYLDVELPPIAHPEKPLGKTTWHRSGEFMKYNRWNRNPNDDREFATLVRRHYAACVSYADACVARVIENLDRLKLRDDTIIVLWGDHGWHLGEHAVWGKHTLFEESLRSPLIVSYPDLPKPGTASDAIVETIDIFPTLCDLTSLPTPQGLHGTSLKPILESPDAPGHVAVSYSKARTIRDQQYRLVLHRGGEVELYDHTHSDRTNIAEKHPAVVSRLKRQLQQRLALKSKP